MPERNRLILLSEFYVTNSSEFGLNSILDYFAGILIKIDFFYMSLARLIGT